MTDGINDAAPADEAPPKPAKKATKTEAAPPQKFRYRVQNEKLQIGDAIVHPPSGEALLTEAEFLAAEKQQPGNLKYLGI